MPVRRARASTKNQLLGRLLDLEERLVALEARLSGANVSNRRASRAKTSLRPRCPGCLLETPKGKRGPSCVWCGFYFDAVRTARNSE